MSRSHVGRWTPIHKGLFAVAVSVAAMCFISIILGG